MSILKAPLFKTYKERFIAFSILFFIFLSNLFFHYLTYKKLIDKRYYETTAIVLNQYEKDTHTVIKLKSKEGFVFYTTSKENLKDLRGRFVKVLLIKSRYSIDFLSFLRGFYYTAYIKSVLHKKSLKSRISSFISTQHNERDIANIYDALFLGKPLSKKIREIFSYLGISHLVAISGFHFGLISFTLFLIFNSIYKPFQQKFFPYRNRAFDAMIFVSISTLFYLLF